MGEKTDPEVPILSRLKPPPGAVRGKRRKGRGPGSGLGKTCGRGQKGQKARSGSGGFIGFEGGQMPLQRRLPKVGFHYPFAKQIAAVNIGALNRFADQSVVDQAVLVGARLVRKRCEGIKILGQGELNRALTVRALSFSASAREKIEKAGGRAEIAGEAEKNRKEAGNS